jgi:phenylalanine-4-hydroxylase
MGQSLFHPVIDSDEARRALEEAEHQAKLPRERIALDAMTIAQHPERYRPSDHQAWRTVFERRMAELREDGSRAFLAGSATLGLREDRVPSLDALNAQLEPLTGWRSVAVPGYLPPRSFFAFLARRRFPTTISVRPLDRLDYLPEPDILHDVFGHLPLLTDPVYADFLQAYGETALDVTDPERSEGLARLFWFTVEFGLVREEGALKLYGAGLLSSPGEGRHALRSAEVERRPFDLEAVLDTPFEIDHFQPVLYVLERFEELRDAMQTLRARYRVPTQPVVREATAAPDGVPRPHL